MTVSLIIWPSLSFAKPVFETCTNESCVNLEEFSSTMTTVMNEVPELEWVFGFIRKIQLSDTLKSNADVKIKRLKTGQIFFDLIISTKAYVLKDNISKILNSKEVTVFGNSIADPPQYLIELPSKYPGLFYITIHELGHIVDHLFGVNQLQCATPKIESVAIYPVLHAVTRSLNKKEIQFSDVDCVTLKNSFSAVSWSKFLVKPQGVGVYVRTPKSDHTLLDKVCYYENCNKNVTWTQKEVYELYDFLIASSFTTLYSANFSTLEEFGEAFVINYLAMYTENSTYTVNFKNHKGIDFLNKINEPNYIAKRNLLSSILENIEERSNHLK
ncbi:MAG: hypothetical protein HOO06_05440 [Bdellovibrionaceae bacterium]|nr:hypothetical protein [Pseudobdellovibrionaceae bacterium]